MTVSVLLLSPQNCVIKIVREKYLNTTAFTDKEKLQAFLSELYVFLVDQLHVALNKVMRRERKGRDRQTNKQIDGQTETDKRIDGQTEYGVGEQRTRCACTLNI